MHQEPIDPDVDLHVQAHRTETALHRATLPAIALGGAAGATARHWLELLWPVTAGNFPWATFATNVSGCLLIGVLMVIVQETSAAHSLVRPFLGVGVLGGFTTFSTYAVQVRSLIAESYPTLALAYLFGTLAACLLAVMVGLSATRSGVHRHWRRPSNTDPEMEQVT